jgi:5'-methylthioadenosine phosphorylase
MPKIGIIGGSGLYEMEGVTDARWQKVSTPFGDPSDEVLTARVGGVEFAFLPRHGRGHRISPSNINYRANIYALKSLGVERIVSVSACGSLKEELKPLDFVIPTQFVDRTHQARKSTFFDEGIVAHVMFADPVCEETARVVYDSACGAGVHAHFGGAYICMEGPQFSTRAESNLYRQWGMDIIGMTNMPEAKLAREAQMSYVTLAAITDYDCWREEEEAVSVDAVIATFRQNIANAKKILRDVIVRLNALGPSPYADALKFAIMTDPKVIPVEMKERLKLLIGEYIS